MHTNRAPISGPPGPSGQPDGPHGAGVAASGGSFARRGGRTAGYVGGGRQDGRVAEQPLPPAWDQPAVQTDHARAPSSGGGLAGRCCAAARAAGTSESSVVSGRGTSPSHPRPLVFPPPESADTDWTGRRTCRARTYVSCVRPGCCTIVRDRSSRRHRRASNRAVATSTRPPASIDSGTPIECGR